MRLACKIWNYLRMFPSDVLTITGELVQWGCCNWIRFKYQVFLHPTQLTGTAWFCLSTTHIDKLSQVSTWFETVYLLANSQFTSFKSKQPNSIEYLYDYSLSDLTKSRYEWCKCRTFIWQFGFYSIITLF